MWFYVNVIDRLTDECVRVGSMLTLAELRELVFVLQKFNSTDLIISKGVEEI